VTDPSVVAADDGGMRAVIVKSSDGLDRLGLVDPTVPHHRQVQHALLQPAHTHTRARARITHTNSDELISGFFTAHELNYTVTTASLR